MLVLGMLGLVSAWSQADEASPVFLNITRDESAVELQWRADPGSTQWVQRATQPSTNPVVWTTIFTNIPPTPATNTLADPFASTNPQAFYRIRTDQQSPSPKIGQTAVLTTRYHGVSGTAEIVDAHTLRVTNFNYDSGGLLVYLIVSPNSSFTPYTAISGDLIRGTPYVNETLDFSIPSDADLDQINYISVWCVDVSVSFGDGQFQ